MEVLEYDRKEFGRSGQIENPVASCPRSRSAVRQPLLQAVVALWRPRIAPDMKSSAAAKAFHVVGIDRLAARKLSGGFT